MDPIKTLFEDLHSPDPSIRLSVLSRIEVMSWTDELLSAFKESIDTEKDPGTLFHMKKILAMVEAKKSGQTLGGSNPLQEIHSSLKQKDDLSLVMIVESVKRSEAQMVAKILRELHWERFSEQVLPFLLNFFKKFGETDDSTQIEELCRHPNPRVLASAIEALEKLNPDRIKALIVPLLVSEVHGIRSRAVRLLHKWDPDEALRHFESMLFSQEPSERLAALFQAFFFPFPEVARYLLRFLSVENDIPLIQRVGLIFRANPINQVLLPLVQIREVCRDEKRNVIGEILMGVINSLFQAKLVEMPPAEILSDLKVKYRRRKAQQLLEHSRIALISGTEQNRLEAVMKLRELAKAGFEEAEEVLTIHLPDETSEEVQNLISGHFNQEEERETSPGQVLGDMTSEQRVRFLLEISPDQFNQVKDHIFHLLVMVPVDEKPLFLQTIGKHGSKDDCNAVLPWLEESDPKLVSAAIEALQTIDPEKLFPIIPRLLLSDSELVRVSAISAISQFDKKQALEMFAQVLQSAQPEQRSLAISNLGQLDFPSVSHLFIETLERESDGENLQQLRAILKANIDEEIFTHIVRIRGISEGEKRGALDAIVVETARTLIREKKVPYTDHMDLQNAVEKALAKNKQQTTDEKPFYSLDNIKKLRQENAPAPGKVNPVQALAADLHSPELAKRFSVLARVENIVWTPERVAEFKKLLFLEKDESTKFQMQKILVQIDRIKT